MPLDESRAASTKSQVAEREAKKRKREEAERLRKAKAELAASTRSYQAAARAVPKAKVVAARKAKKKAEEKAAWRKAPPSKSESQLIKSGLLDPRATRQAGGLGNVPILSAVSRDVEAFGRGFIPATAMFAKAAWADRNKSLLDLTDADDLRDYMDLARWTFADAKGDKKQRPPTESELFGLIAASVREMGRGFERGVPDVTNPEDIAEAQKSWQEHPVFTALDTIPAAALFGRAGSIAANTSKIARANEIGIGGALRAGAKESYRPGSAARAGLEGGIEPRIARSAMGDEIARPWSRSPLFRGMQQAYDDVLEASPKRAEHRVGRLRERADTEAKRAVDLEAAELTRPIMKFAFSKLGRFKGAFGPRKGMTPSERAKTTALFYAFEMPEGMDPGDALRAVVADKVAISKSGRWETPDRGTAPLSKADQANLTREINDIQRTIDELDADPAMAEEMTEALYAMKAIADRSEKQGLEIMERQDPDNFDAVVEQWGNRKNMIIERLKTRGYLPKDAGPSWGYLPHREFWDLAETQYRGGGRPAAAGRTIGRTRLDSKTVERRPNELIRYQKGNLSPDPAQLLALYLNRVRMQVTLEARDVVYAHALDPDDVKDASGGWWVREPGVAAKTISPEAQQAVRMGRERMEKAVEADEVHPPDEILGQDFDTFRKEFISRVNERPDWKSEPGVRWVSGDFVDARFGNVFDSAPRGDFNAVMSILNSAQRATSIYFKPISYIAGNVPFNLMALISQQPVSLISDLPRAYKMQLGIGSPTGRATFRRAASVAGETKATGGLPSYYTGGNTKWQARAQRATGIQRGVAEGLSEVADDTFRVTALMRNARKKGYHSEADLNRLMDADTPETRRDLADVRQLTRDQMLDFDALNPTMRKIAANYLFLAPFIYAATKWPLMFTREYPLRAGFASQQIEESSKKAGLVPQALSNLLRTRLGGLDLGTLNPIGPAADIAEGATDLLKDPSQANLSILADRLNPTLAALVEGAGGGYPDLLKNLVRTTVPGASELFATEQGGSMRGAKTWEQDEDKDLLDYLLQRHLRFYPRPTNETVIKERIDKFRSDRIKGATIDRDKDADWKKIGKYVGAVAGYSDEDIQNVRTSFKAWWHYQEAVDEKKDSTGQRNLTAIQGIEILDEVLRENYPDETELWDITVLKERAEADDTYEKRNEEILEEYEQSLKDYINAGRTEVFNRYRNYARAKNEEDTYGGEEYGSLGGDTYGGETYGR